eukprot:6822643-Alexandrium_andersonii.AAC.1
MASGGRRSSAAAPARTLIDLHPTSDWSRRQAAAATSASLRRTPVGGLACARTGVALAPPAPRPAAYRAVATSTPRSGGRAV